MGAETALLALRWDDCRLYLGQFFVGEFWESATGDWVGGLFAPGLESARTCESAAEIRRQMEEEACAKLAGAPAPESVAFAAGVLRGQAKVERIGAGTYAKDYAAVFVAAAERLEEVAGWLVPPKESAK
jgi:hypothetical protein